MANRAPSGAVIFFAHAFMLINLLRPDADIGNYISNCMLKDPLSTANRKKALLLMLLKYPLRKTKHPILPVIGSGESDVCVGYMTNQMLRKQNPERYGMSAHAYEAALGLLGFRTAAMINAHFPAGRQSEPLR